eukprot:gnl/MRDRNA2_/MRDRNA2_98137_c0_seq1.p1 gnl/MRDRNA2_/MRDRNA2_98137_c0~~gnl/MRDRNA2_/MRDRNA2_98137_c0_seq1.p1  ORF type:complete len:338 (-),score=86.57 gnl/MRDRNA2_/MRDRNA2_98137_c0_seq1:34-1047(-)
MGRSRSREGDEKKEKKKKRSRSSESAERSREREKRRRKEQLKNAKPAGGGGGGALGMGGGAPGAMPALGGIPGVSAGQQMFWDGFQWVPRAQDNATNNVDATRKLRRLYLGNLPYHLGVTEDSFSTQLFNTMKERGLCNDSEQNPIQHVWFAREKGANYGFVEMASVEETERALGLDGMMVCGVPITIKRINDSVSPLASIGNIRPGMPPAPGMPGSAQLALPAVMPTATSPIIRIAEILKPDQKTTPEDYTDVVEDMNEGCGAHGKLLKAVIIRPADKIKLPGPDYNIGDVFLECASVEDATKVMRAMGHRKYDGRQIDMKSFDKAIYDRTVKISV